MESRLMSLLESEPNGVDVNELLGLLGASASDATVALNALLADHRVELIKFGDTLRVATRSAESDDRLSNDESLLNSLVIDAGNKGISIPNLWMQSRLSGIDIDRALKSLEQKKLIKAVKFVGQMRAFYMPYDAVEDANSSDHEFDSERQRNEDRYMASQRYREQCINSVCKEAQEELVNSLNNTSID